MHAGMAVYQQVIVNRAITLRPFGSCQGGHLC